MTHASSAPSLTAQIDALAQRIASSDAILIGAGSGISAAAGFRHYYERDEQFVRVFGAFERKYGFHNTFEGYYHAFPSSAHRWAFNATFMCLSLDAPATQPYADLHALLQGRPYHILTTNQDTQFNRLFPEEKISAIQGDVRFFQCSRRCRDVLYPSAEAAHAMRDAINSDLAIPESLIPRCPHCGAEMEIWMRGPAFLEGERYQDAYARTNAFLRAHRDERLLLWELGVGRMTPMFIQQPFWQLTQALPRAFYATVNPRDALLPRALEAKGMALHADIAEVMAGLRQRLCPPTPAND